MKNKIPEWMLEKKNFIAILASLATLIQSVLMIFNIELDTKTNAEIVIAGTAFVAFLVSTRVVKTSTKRKKKVEELEQ